MHMVEEYINASVFQYRDGQEIVEEFEKELSKMKGKCIDIGCGPGTVTATLLLPRLAPESEIIGADISQLMVDYAREKYRDEKRLSFRQLDIEVENLPEDEVGQYNNVFSFYCLHWCKDVRLALVNVYKLLRPGGMALILFLASNSGFDAYLKLASYEQYEPYTQDADCYIPFFYRCEDARAALRQMLEDIGFEVLHCSRREKSYIFRNLQELKDHMIVVNPFITRIPDYLKEDFTDVLSREIANLKIQFRNNIDNNQEEYSILDRYQLLVTHFRKPSNAH